jgi:hypothetical protein
MFILIPARMISIHKVQHVFHNTCYVPTRRYYRRNFSGPIPLLTILERAPLFQFFFIYLIIIIYTIKYMIILCKSTC